MPVMQISSTIIPKIKRFFRKFTFMTNNNPTPNFTLRPFREGDQASLVANANNIKIFNNVRDNFPHPYKREDANWWIDAQKETDKPANCLAIDINGEVIGGIGIVLNSDIHRLTAEMGYWLGEPQWGKGIMSEAVRQMIDYIFTTFPDLIRLWAAIFEHNKPSMRVLEKAGFEFEGIRKKGAVKNGLVIDEHVYVKLRKQVGMIGNVEKNIL